MKITTRFNNFLNLCILFLMVAQALPLRAQEPASESALNGEYRELILQQLRSDIASRQKSMQNHANSLLLNLPIEEKLYDESKFHITAKMVDDIREDGRPELNYVLIITYDCKNFASVTDDYPVGDYLFQHSNTAKALGTIAKQSIDDFSSDLFAKGKKVTVRIASSTDGRAISRIRYGGEYGEHRYDAARFNGETVRLSLSSAQGISNNAELAFARALGVQDYLQKNVTGLSQTSNRFEYETYCAKEIGSQYRRVSVEFIVHGAFDEKIISMNEKLINDEFVDFNIPALKPETNANTYVLIIANQQYDAPLPDCAFAENDGAVVRQYCLKTLGVPERHIKVLNNASIDNLRTEGIRWLKDITLAVRGNANVLVYYSGHGFSDADFKPYLLFSDFNTRNVRSWVGKTELDPDAYLTKRETKTLIANSLALDTLCSWFNKVATTGITFIIDAGFNGTQRSGEPLFNIKRSDARIKGLRIRSDIVIFSAADVNKTAYAFEEQRHGFLTYFLLKELKRTKGKVTYGQLYDALLKNVSYESSLQGKLQEPLIISGGKTKEAWQDFRFK